MGNKSILLTIGIPNYNYSLYIEQTIQSVIQQIGEDIEILISDNCSTDNSWEIIQSFSDSRIKKWKQNENIGMHGNWNFLLSKANGKYFLLLPSDDFLAKDFIKIFKQIYDKIQVDDIETIVWGYGNVYNSSQITEYDIPKIKKEYEIISANKSGLMLSHFSTPWAHAQLTSALINSGCFNVESRRPDTLLFYTALNLKLDQKILIIKNPLSFQRIHDLNERNNQIDYVIIDNIELSKIIRNIETNPVNKIKLNLLLTHNFILLIIKYKKLSQYHILKSISILDYFIIAFLTPIVILIVSFYKIYPSTYTKKIYKLINL